MCRVLKASLLRVPLITAVVLACSAVCQALRPGELIHVKKVPGQWECIIYEDGRVESLTLPHQAPIMQTKFHLSRKALNDLKLLMEKERLSQLPEKCGQEDGIAGHRVWMEFKMGNKVSVVEAILNERVKSDELNRFTRVWNRVSALWLDPGPKQQFPSVFPPEPPPSR